MPAGMYASSSGGMLIRPLGFTSQFHCCHRTGNSSRCMPLVGSIVPSGLIWNWYHTISHATVSTTSRSVGDRGTTLARGVPSVRERPASVRACCVSLKLASATGMAAAPTGVARRSAATTVRRRFRGLLMMRRMRPALADRPRVSSSGVDGRGRSPYRCACGAQSSQTSNGPSPCWLKKPRDRSPMRSVRPHTRHRITSRVVAPNCATHPGS